MRRILPLFLLATMASAPSMAQNLTPQNLTMMFGSGTPAFEIKDFSFDVENPTTVGSAGNGAGAGKINFNEFHITKAIEKASPFLFQEMISGSPTSKVVVTLQGQSATAVPQTCLVFTFSDVFVTTINWGDSIGDMAPKETIGFVFGSVSVDYVMQNAIVTCIILKGGCAPSSAPSPSSH